MSALAFLLAGRGMQSALEPAGAGAERIANLWNVFLLVTAVVYVLVIVVLLIALVRRRRTLESGEPRTATTVVSIATGVTVLTLFGLLVASISTGRGIAEPPGYSRITLTGHQWWWAFEYNDPESSRRVTTANEITIPVGVPVKILLRSTDVIHSFWVPNLAGKQDLIPGHDGTITLLARRPGVYRGQCAEFCGLQHAKMAFWVNAVPPAEYEQWMAMQREPSRIPSTQEERKGQEVFMSSPCPLCHTIQGTDSSGRTGPDLTHFGSRRSIAAGTLPNNRGNLAGWILDPQHVKPGNQMPPMLMDQGNLNPLLTYLESLQ